MYRGNDFNNSKLYEQKLTQFIIKSLMLGIIKKSVLHQGRQYKHFSSFQRFFKYDFMDLF